MEARRDSARSVEHAIRRSGPPPWVGYLIGPAFLCVGGWFLWDSQHLEPPVTGPAEVPPLERLSTEPHREPLGDPPVVTIDGSQYTCMECHHLFPPREPEPQVLYQHRHVVLEHGINHNCRNCHHPYDRNKLVMYDGTVVTYEHVPELCQKCHGPTYRDWQRGAHGRTNGYWDASRGEVRRLKCTACHNPHQPRKPAMSPIEPLPAPKTLHVQPHGAPEHNAESGPSGVGHDPLSGAAGAEPGSHRERELERKSVEDPK